MSDETTLAEAIAAWNTRACDQCEGGACDEQVERHTVMGKSEPPNYCPKCGAKVVER